LLFYFPSHQSNKTSTFFLLSQGNNINRLECPVQDGVAELKNQFTIGEPGLPVSHQKSKNTVISFVISFIRTIFLGPKGKKDPRSSWNESLLAGYMWSLCPVCAFDSIATTNVPVSRCCMDAFNRASPLKRNNKRYLQRTIQIFAATLATEDWSSRPRCSLSSGDRTASVFLHGCSGRLCQQRSSWVRSLACVQKYERCVKREVLVITPCESAVSRFCIHR